MSVTNLGTQTINWKYKTSLKGSNLSKMFNGCINPGIYLNNGSYIQPNIGLITSYAGNQITINAFTAVFKASSTQTVTISTAVPIALSTDGSLGYITSAAPYIVMSYTWADQIINYIDFAFKAVGDITAYDIVIGKAVFTGGSVTSIDYSEASYPPYYNPTTQEYNVFGGIKLDGKKINKEVTTAIDANTITNELICDTSLFFSPTADRTLDITAGATYEDTDLYVYNNSATHKLTITYFTSSTVDLTPSMFIKFKWNGVRWICIAESRIGKIDHGYIVPRGGAELNGGLRTKDALWKYIQTYYASLIDTEVNWQAGGVGKFVDYDATQYRLPDFRGLFERNAGTNSKRLMANNSAFSGGNSGSVSDDKMQGHWHEVNRAFSGAPTGLNNGIGTAGAYADVVGYRGIGNPTPDGSNGAPRTGTETKPASISLIPFIYFED